jgi:S-(hydroxymethyl)glutathione synthase
MAYGSRSPKKADPIKADTAISYSNPEFTTRKAHMSKVLIHPLLTEGIPAGSESFTGGMLRCLCESDPVKVAISSQVAHNHACGCTKCWKPEGAAFSIVAVVPTSAVQVVENVEKLEVVDPAATIKRHVCTKCGVHLHGPVENPGHPFFGLSFIHPERFVEDGAAPPAFAAFVSSIIESGVAPDQMDDVRGRLKGLGLEPYDCLNPPLMDFIATHVAKASGVLTA